MSVASVSAWQAIATHLGLSRQGNRLVGPCPACGGSAKSTRFQVTLSGRHQGAVKCWAAGCSGKEILIAAGLWQSEAEWRAGREADRPGPAASRRRPAQREDPQPKRQDNRARRMWARTEPAPDTVRRYLAGRGVWPPHWPVPDAVRWLPGDELQRLPWKPENRPPGAAAGAMAFLYTRGTEIAAVELEALDDEGRRPEPRWRRTLGRSAGALFRVDGVDGAGELAIAEGPLDALALRAWTGVEAWAGGGTSGIKALAATLIARALPVTVHCDGDRSGRLVAAELQDLLLEAGVRARVAYCLDSQDPAEELAETWSERAAELEAGTGLARSQAEAMAWSDLLGQHSKGVGDE